LEPGEAKTMEANGKAKRSDLVGTELATENDSEWRVANGEWFFSEGQCYSAAEKFWRLTTVISNPAL
jgi:hypothetical protein